MADFAVRVMSTSGPTREGPTLAEQVARELTRPMLGGARGRARGHVSGDYLTEF